MLQLFSADDHIIEPADVWTRPGSGEVPRRRPPRRRRRRPRVLGLRGPARRDDGPQRRRRQASRPVQPRSDPVLRHASRLLRPEGAGQGHAAGRDPRQHPVPDAAPVLGHAVPQVQGQGAGRRLRDGLQRLRHRRVVSRRPSRHVRPDDHLAAVGPRARGSRDPSLRRAGGPGAVVPGEPGSARAAVVLDRPLGPGLAGVPGDRRGAVPAHRHQRRDAASRAPRRPRC